MKNTFSTSIYPRKSKRLTAVKLENMKITGSRSEVSEGWKSYWKKMKKEPDGTVILKDGKVFIGFDLILTNVEFDVLWFEDLDIGNVTLEECTFKEGIHLKDVNVKDMEVKTRVKKKMRDKKNSFIIHDSKIKRLTVAVLDQFFKFRQQDSNIDRLDIF